MKSGTVQLPKTTSAEKNTYIYFPQIPNIQGKAIRRRPGQHKTIPSVSLPPLIPRNHHNVELSMYFSFVNGSPFLHIKPRKIDFMSVQSCNSRGKYETIYVLNQVKTKYKDRGFTITDLHGNNEFENIHNFLAPAHLHTCSANEHIRDINRSIRKIKEQVRCGCHSIPYKKFTKLMAGSLVQDIKTCLNMFLSKNGKSRNLGPAAIILGSPNPDYNKLKITFGSYS